MLLFVQLVNFHSYEFFRFHYLSLLSLSPTVQDTSISLTYQDHYYSVTLPTSHPPFPETHPHTTTADKSQQTPAKKTAISTAIRVQFNCPSKYLNTSTTVQKPPRRPVRTPSNLKLVRCVHPSQRNEPVPPITAPNIFSQQ